MGYAFSRKQRLNTQSQFRRIFSSHQRRFNSKVFTAYFCGNELAYPRIGIIVAKKNIALSVRRNAFKRVVRDWFRRSQRQLKSVDVVFLARGAANIASNSDLRTALDECLIGLLV